MKARPQPLPRAALVAAIVLAPGFAGAPPAHAAPAPAPADKAAAKGGARCYPPQGEVVSSAKLMKDLADGRDVDLTGKIIDGNIDAEIIAGPAADDSKSSIRVIRGRLKRESCRINGGFSLTRTVLNDLSLNCTELAGELDLSESGVRGALSLDNAVMGGAVRLARTRLDRD